MARHPDAGSIPTEMTCMLDYRGAALHDCLLQCPTAVMAVDTATDLITGIEIGERGRPHPIAGS